MTEEEARVLSYLRAQGAKLSPSAIVDKVRVAMAQLRAAAEAVPAARWAERPAPDEWSGNDVMAHVVDAGRHFGDEIVRALDGRPHRDAAGDKREPERHSAREWCAVLDREREALFGRALAADPAARLDDTIDHGMFGRLNWRETLLFLRVHDLDHAGQLQKIAAALGGDVTRSPAG
jgi:uncharacterized damage-inducible protein DinB